VRTPIRGLVGLVLTMSLAVGVAACTRPPGGVPPTTTTTTPPVTTPGGGLPTPTTTKVRYGPGGNATTPFTLQPAGASGMTMIANRIIPNVSKPCSNCYLMGMQADLVRPNGESVNVDDGLWLHHMVMFQTGVQDVTCPNLGVGIMGQRFFSSGNERTPTIAGGPYGYKVGATGWTLIADLMGMSRATEQVFIEVTFNWLPANTPGVRPITPVWMDIFQCGTSEMPAKTGKYSYTYQLTSNRAGKLLGIGGHIHDGGTNVVITKNGQVVCDSVATYGGRPEYIEGPNSTHMPGMGHISEMHRCQGTAENPVTTVAVGDKLALSANYDSNAHMQMGTDPVMGIAIGYFDFG
jgi:hypothetical protein